MKARTPNHMRKSKLLRPKIPYDRTPFICSTSTFDYLGEVSRGIAYPKIGNLIDTSDYFDFQRQTSGAIDRVKDAAASVYGSMFHGDFPELDRVVLHLHYKRRGTVHLHGVHSRIYILALGGDEDEYNPRVGASLEFLLEDMYYLNQFFDSKSGSDAPKKIVAAIKSNDLFWPLLVPPIENTKKAQKVFTGINKDYNEMISGFYFGEFIDCCHNIWAGLKDASFGERLRRCNRRSNYITALFFQAVANIAGKVISIYQERQVDRNLSSALGKYAFYFGMGLQIVNDVADFIPVEYNRGTGEKSPEDSYSDIKNRKMTYPVIAMLEMADNPDRERVVECLESGFHVNGSELMEITRVFLRSGAYHECRALSRRYKSMACEMAREFPDQARFLLSRSAVVLDSNRYYSTFSDLLKSLGKS